MASEFQIGSTVETLTALDELAIPVTNPQEEFKEFQTMKRLGNLSMRGFGPSSVTWEFQIVDVSEVEELEALQSTDPIYIRTRNKAGDFTVYEVLMNWPDPKQDGQHNGMQGIRSKLAIEFIILSEVGGS